MTNNDKQFLTADEVGKMLGLRRDYIYNLCRRHEIPFKRIGRYFRFVRSEIEGWMKNEEQ